MSFVVGFRTVRRLLVTANVPSSLLLVTLMMEALRSSETLIPKRATRHNISEDGILHNDNQFPNVLVALRQLYGRQQDMPSKMFVWHVSVGLDL
jgi:hypothetical protein